MFMPKRGSSKLGTLCLSRSFLPESTGCQKSSLPSKVQSYHVTPTDSHVVRRHVDHISSQSCPGRLLGNFQVILQHLQQLEWPHPLVPPSQPQYRHLQHGTVAGLLATYRLRIIYHTIITLNHFKTKKGGMW